VLEGFGSKCRMNLEGFTDSALGTTLHKNTLHQGSATRTTRATLVTPSNIPGYAYALPPTEKISADAQRHAIQ